MSPQRESFSAGILFTILPLLLLTADKLLIDCAEHTRMFSYVFGHIHEFIKTSTLLIPVGVLLLFVSFVLKRRSQGTSSLRIVYDVVLLFSLLLLLGSVVLASLNTARSKGPNAEVKATVSILRVEAELFFDSHKKSYAGFCTSAKFLDSLTRLREYTPKQGLLCRIPQHEIVCNDTYDTYAVSVKLPSQYDTSMKYFCADNSGFSKETEQILTGTRCE